MSDFGRLSVKKHRVTPDEAMGKGGCSKYPCIQPS
jgi:hypothetical protein